MYSKKSNDIVFAEIGEHVEINPALAMTPAQMNQMLMAGQPIATSNLASQFYEGSENLKFSDFEINDQRGIDASDVWQEQQESRHKVKKLSRLREKVAKNMSNNPS